MNLSDIFTAVAYKKLVQVDIPGGSNQHEINGSSPLKNFFHTMEAVSGHIKWHYFADNKETVKEEGEYTFYDARARSAARTGRSEWRFYYTGDFLRCAASEDVLILARTDVDEDIYGLVFQADSSFLRAVKSLFVLKDTSRRISQIQLIPTDELNERELETVSSLILSELDIEYVFPVRETDIELVARKFGKSFPATIELSQLARENIDVDMSDPDETLLRWLKREEELFFALEKQIVQEKLDKGFTDVDEFIKYSLSVQNRRKSRMGHAFQHHMKALFDAKGVKYKDQAITEGKNKPDFLFPGKTEYDDLSFNSTYLTMLALKSTAKDRWRQILTEADRIPEKHLCTLEPSISTSQTNEMRQQRVRLVIPSRLLKETYTESQRKEAMTITDFLNLVLEKQAFLNV